MTPKPKLMDAKEARRLGIIQEVNRRLLHPRGLALTVMVDNDTGEVTYDGIQDFREDFDDGVTFLDAELSQDKADRFDALIAPRRLRALGRLVQPLPELRHVWRKPGDGEPLEEGGVCVRCGAYANSEAAKPCEEL